MRKTVLLVAICAVSVAQIATGQSNDLLDELLDSERVRLGHAAYLVLTAAGEIDETADPSLAAARLASHEWWRWSADAESVLTLGRFSYMVMRVLGMRGGIMYTVFPGPRYAARELDFLGLITGDPGPYRTLRGEEAVTLLRRALEYTGGSL